MSDWRNYISVLTPAASSGTQTFYLETFDAIPNIALTIACTAGSGDNEITVARKIYDQFTCALIAYTIPGAVSQNAQSMGLTSINAFFDGVINVADFSNMAPDPTFRLGRSDQVCSLFSQAQFRLQLLSNTTGTTLLIDESPNFCTLAEAKNIAPLLGVDYSDIDEVALTDDQLNRLMGIASAQMVRLLNNNLVISTYVDDIIGTNVGSVRVRNKPIIAYDIPQTRRPYIIGITSILITKSPVAYQVDRKLGILNYRFTNSLIEISEPMDQNNEMKFSYAAGYMNIPRIIKEKTVQLASMILEDPNIKTLKGGSFTAEFVPSMATVKWILAQLREYFNSTN